MPRISRVSTETGEQVYPRVCGGTQRASLLAADGADRVYPRVCGGTSVLSVYRNRRTGLSPRVRGNPKGRTRSGGEIGSIPACAGEPMFYEPPEYAEWVYPRVCGGTMREFGREHQMTGLSPRMRGNLGTLFASLARARSIPACAGEPLPGWPPRFHIPVYPRVCGGTLAPSRGNHRRQGLSPRVRGNHSPPQPRND